MTQLNTTHPVLVTGATGYLAGWIVKKLLEQGVTVHAAVRDPSKTEKLKYLNKIADASAGSIRYFKADLMTEGSYAEAMEGCEIVFHTASPFTIRVEDPQRDLVDPAQLGTRNVLEQANKTETVKRVVVTSSCAAIYGDNIDLEKTPDGVFTEDIWNTSSSLDHQAYSYSKTMAEKEAWRIADAQDRWKLVCINPTLIMGPAINPNAGGESMSMMVQFGDGTLKMGAPDYGFGIVDVRDVAEAHLAAAFKPEANGRNITSAHNASLPDIAKALAPEYKDRYPIPKRILPKWLVWLVAPLADKAMTRKIVSLNIGYPWIGDNSKSIRELGITYRPLEETINDMFKQLIDAGRIKN